MGTILSSLGIFLIITSLVFGSFHIQVPFFIHILGSTKVTLSLGVLFFLLGRELSTKTLKLLVPLSIVFLGVSHLATHRFFFLQSTPFRWNYLAALVLGFILARFIGIKRSGFLLFALSIILPLSGFFITSEGRLLFSDDHPSFLYRLLLLWEEFPSIPFYSPQWNGGYDAREFFPSGSLAPFFMGFPLFLLFGIKDSYNLLASFLVFVLPSLSVYFASRKLGQNKTASCYSAIVAGASSSLWFTWGLTYGTLGFLVSASLAPWCYSFAATYSRSSKLLGIFIFSLSLFWPLGGVIILPALLLLIKKRAFLFLLILSAIHLTWIPIFLSASKVGSFVQAENSERKKPSITETPLETFRENFEKANPLILFLGSVLVIRKKFISLVALYLLLLGVGVPMIKPHLEFDRMLVVLFLTLSIPLGALLASIKGKISQGLLLALLCLSIFQTTKISLNKTPIIFHFEGSESKFVTEEMKRLKPEGRVLFAGFTLHELSGGHVAPLPELTNTQMMASRYQHDTWKYQDIVPLDYREKGSKGINEYLKLYNVEYIITHDNFWGAWYQKRADAYQKTSEEKKFRIFKRLRFSSDWTLEGELLELKQNRNSIELVPLSSDLTIRFNYLPFLRSSDCEISGSDISSQIKFISLKNCPIGKKIVIKSISPFSRIF